MMSEATVTPVFLFSLPRSGSTLLQRIIASHPAVGTAPEPWLLLPFVHAMRPGESYAEYNHKTASHALQEFAGRLPGGMQDYRSALRDFVLALYGRAAAGRPFFLDKTPRYHVIAEEIMQVFPEARFIFLFRNPLAIYSSIQETWHLPHVFRYDLYKGFDALYGAYRDSSGKGLLVTYEALVCDADKVVHQLCEYIGIDFQPGMVEGFSAVKFQPGDLGNPNPAQAAQTTIVENSVDKWIGTLSRNIVRRNMALAYLDFIGEARMSQLGYDYGGARSALLSAPVGLSGILQDIAGWARGFISISLETHMLRDRLRAVRERRRLYAHR